MLVTFISDAHENIVMFGDVAIQLIKMMGQSGTVPSAIVAEDVPEALAKLKQALQKVKADASAPDMTHENEPPVRLAHRALPLLQLLQNAEKHHCDVLWS